MYIGEGSSMEMERFSCRCCCECATIKASLNAFFNAVRH